MIAEYLISKGGNVSHRNTHGNTPVHKAAQHGAHRVLQLMIDKGEDLNLFVSRTEKNYMNS